MGGIMIVLSLDVTVLLWAKWNEFLALSLMSVVVLAALGFYDDWVKLTKQDKAGIHSKVKLAVQLALACSSACTCGITPTLSRAT